LLGLRAAPAPLRPVRLALAGRGRGVASISSPRHLLRLGALAARHAKAAKELAETTDFSSPVYAGLAQETARLDAVHRAHEGLRSKRAELAELDGLIGGDAELRQLAVDEKCTVEAELHALEVAVTDVLAELDTSSSPDDVHSAAVVEVRAGVGGDEGALFAQDLFTMYRLYAAQRSWAIELLGDDSMVLRGRGALAALSWEAGVHRVQRVPATEQKGRVHTSTASVAVLSEAEEADLEINDSDLKIETCRASGAGGQHVNTTDSAVRIVHLPSGIVAQCQDERSQQENKKKAMVVLRARILAHETAKLDAERTSNRREQIGSNTRSERIRTYNFHDDRITDHRCALTLHGIPRMLRGELLDEFADALRKAEALAAEEAETEELLSR